MSAYLIGIDVGTQSVKSVLFDEYGTRIAMCSKALSLQYPSSDAVEQDPDEIYRAVITSVHSVVEQSRGAPSNIVALGVDAQMAGIIGVDRDLTPITPYDSWLDTRCEPDAERMRREAEKEIIFSTGGQIGIAHGAKILWRHREDPQGYRCIFKFITLSTYLTARLCGLSGEALYIDDTHLHFSGFANSEKRVWNRDLLRIFGVDEEKLPVVKSSCEIVGGVSDKAAEATGLLAGTPVVAGCGDTAASVLGAGITEPGYFYDIAGTASVFAGCTSLYSPDVENKTLNYMRSPIEGLWNPLAYINGGGLCLRWYRNLSGKSYAELDSLAESVNAGSDGLIFIPHFTGRIFPNDPTVKGSFIGLNWNHSSGELYRSIMESIAYEYNIYKEILERKDSETKPICVVGVGGGAGSHVFNQIKADVLKIPYARLEFEDSAPYGAALLAGYGCGLYKSLESAALQKKNISEMISPSDETPYLITSKQYKTILKNFGNLFSTEEKESL